MSLITACPACQTEFEVTPEQLEAYDGQVRCGTCEHVFNAKDHLIQDGSSDKAALNAVFNDLDLRASEPNQSISGQSTLGQSSAASEDAHQVEAEQPAFDSNRSPLLQGLQAVDEVQSQFNKPAPEVNDGFVIPPKVNLAFNTEPEVNMSSVPSFLQDIQMDRPDFHETKQGSHTLGYGLFAFVLLLLLGLQTAYSLRTELAAQYPVTKPWLVKGCQLIGCKVELPKNIALLTIDDADMQEHLEREGVLEFSSTLINHGNVLQAFPLIELTLTNIDDEPVMRRSFKPEEYLHKLQNNELEKDIEAGLQAQEEVRVKMTLTANNTNVAGFRVGLSYP